MTKNKISVREVQGVRRGVHGVGCVAFQAERHSTRRKTAFVCRRERKTFPVFLLVSTIKPEIAISTREFPLDEVARLSTPNPEEERRQPTWIK